ncbi:prepilin-type N-terminal cleavage/methylation domain-containing protein, partial [Candidatus Gracilibacteria bacterium]|nr:prepilin-type N-terminal cleavage/methylation domain-containing protein [Candidatus Gracilibacteria bacterium]
MSKFGIIVKNKISEAKKKKAFTLVELIIVITILAVLAAIAFLNLNGYTGDARDSVRVSDLKNIQKTVELSLGEGNLLPIPDELKTEKIELQELPGVKWQEGLFGDESIKELRDLSQVPLDPKTKSKYRYLVSENRQNYYLEVELENGSKYILTNYGNALALNSAPNAPKTPGNPGGTTTPPPATPQTQDKDKYHPIGQTINAIVGAQVNPSDGIQNKQDLPSTTVYRWKNGTPGENSGTIEVVYPDSSITEITVTINYSCATGHTKVGSECKANTQACAIVNGNGTQALQPNGTYGTCTASTCNANFHKEGNTCTSNTKTCTAPNGTGTQTWNATENSYGACTVNTCNAGHTKVGNECKVNTQNCTVANGNGTQALQPNGTYGTCTVNTCNANFHKEGNTCTSNTKTCTAPNGTGTQTWNATKNSYGACTVNTCNAGYTKVGNECKANTQACTVENGTGTQALQPNGTYGTCTASTCNANFHKEGNECVSNTRECTISSGAGSRVSSGELQLRGRSIESGT